MNEDVIEIETIDLYRFLIGECRYGYTRNNHLMPSFAFDECKKYLPRLLEVDRELAIHTAKQLCDECISHQLVRYFYDGIDDEHGNRTDSINFIEWLLSWINTNGDEKFKPYNYDAFLMNKALDDMPIYLISELIGFDIDTYSYEKAIVLNENKPVSKNEYFDYILDDVCKIKDINGLTYNKLSPREDGYQNGKPTKFIYVFHKPINRVFLVERLNKREDCGKNE